MTRRMAWMLGLAAVLAAALVLDRFVLKPASPAAVTAPVHRTARAKPGAAPAPPAPGKAFLPPLSTFSEIWTRPVFSPSRRPEAVMATVRTQAAPASGNTQSPPALKIVGVAIGPAGGAALVRAGGNMVKRYYVDDTVAGWTIEQITPETVTVSRNGARWLLPVGAQQ